MVQKPVTTRRGWTQYEMHPDTSNQPITSLRRMTTPLKVV